LGSAWLAVLVLAAVVVILGTAVALVGIMDAAADALRLRLLMRREALARLGRHLRLPLASMLPAVIVAFLAGAVTGSFLAGALGLGVTAGAMIAVFLVLGR
jgi:hypothetical protein